MTTRRPTIASLTDELASLRAEFVDAAANHLALSLLADAEIARLREALGFYAAMRNYDEDTGAAGRFMREANTANGPGEIYFKPDGGDVARAALGITS